MFDWLKKALDDTRLLAPFTGTIAKQYIRNYTDIQAKQKIVSLQNNNDLEIIVSVPENIIIEGDESRKKNSLQLTAKFTNIPNKIFALKLKETLVNPDLIISSPAVRAYQTAEILAEVFNYPKSKIDINKYFYFYEEEAVLHQLKYLKDNVQTVFITGHNPVWTDLANRFYSSPVFHLRTSGIVGIGFETDTWKNFLEVKRTDIILIN